MTRTGTRPISHRILAVVLCVAVMVFFCALLTHHHGAGADADHAAHCQVCALGHTMASIAPVIELMVVMQMLLMARFSAPTRGSPGLIALPVTRPPPPSLR